MPTLNMNSQKIGEKAVDLFKEERGKMRLDGWFYIKEIQKDCDSKYKNLHPELKAAKTLYEIVQRLPISISEHAILAGTQRDSFARSYALINPTFKVESFSGYCDPTAVFNDIEPSEDITKEKIEELREYNKKSENVKALGDTYVKLEKFTSEVTFFVEQVSGHLIPDMRIAIANGVQAIICEIDKKLKTETDELRVINYQSMKISLEAVIVLASRYATCARELMKSANADRKQELKRLADTLDKVPANGASSLFEAIQSFFLLWQLMCIEQSPNPFAFSVGNADRIFEPYRKNENLSREMAADLFKHFLVFFNVGDRSWAISQNIIVGGKSNEGDDLTNECTFALLDAYYQMNLPQPILSVKLHKNTP